MFGLDANLARIIQICGLHAVRPIAKVRHKTEFLKLKTFKGSSNGECVVYQIVEEFESCY